MASGFYTDYNPADFYVWSPPSKAVSIHLSLKVVRRMEDEYIGASTQGGRQELAGVLLGYSLTSPARVSFIEDFVVLHEREDTNPALSFRGEVLAQKLGSLARRAGLQQTPVGFFRWQRGGWLSLSDRDLDAALRYFSGPDDVIMLLRYSAARGNEGAFFWREEGAIRYRDALSEFPFNAGKLMPQIAAPTPSRALPAKPEVRPAEASPAAIAPIADAAPGAVRWVPVVHTAAIAMILTGAGIAALQSSHPSPPGPTTEPARQQAAKSPLGLHVTMESGQIVVQWDANAEPIASAQNGVLRIMDSSSSEVLQLDSQQLRDGSVVYRANTRDVSVRLEVKAKDGRTASESVRLLEAGRDG